MKWVLIVLVVLAIALVAWWVARAANQRKQEHARVQADSLRGRAADHAAGQDKQEAKARQAEAEAERARAEADQLDARARDERIAYDAERAHQEDKLREADRLDPDVDTSAPDYTPGPEDPSGGRPSA